MSSSSSLLILPCRELRCHEISSTDGISSWYLAYRPFLTSSLYWDRATSWRRMKSRYPWSASGSSTQTMTEAPSKSRLAGPGWALVPLKTEH